MATLLKLRLGVSDDHTAFQPSLNDCLEAMLKQADFLVTDMLGGLVAACAPSSSQRIAGFQQPGLKAAVQQLSAAPKNVIATYRAELTRLVYEGGGKEQENAEALRFEDLRLFEDDQLDQSIEVARAQQEVSVAVDDVLPTLDALVSSLLGWRTIQPGLNPLRPDVFVRALQTTLAQHVPDDATREVLIAPAAGLLGANLRKLYRELAEWLRTSGIEPAVPIGGRVQKGGGATGAPVVDTVSKALLTLDRLRKLLHGDFDAKTARKDFQYTLPASMSLLQEMKQVDALVHKLEARPKAPPPAEPVDMLAQLDQPAGDGPRLGTQLGSEVIRLMLENLVADRRLLPAFKQQLKLIEPALLKLGEEDSRFFSDRTHPARQFLDRITQRSLGFSKETDAGWPRFMATVEDAVRWLGSKVVDADTFGELLDHLQAQWGGQDESLKHRREEAARALLHAEQRNLLAQKLAAEFAEGIQNLEVPDFVSDFLRSSWAQVVAEAQLSCADGSDDPYGYRALVEDLVWSVQRATATRGRAKRLAEMVPGLLARLREGLERIEYPPELTQRFFNNLVTIHQAAVTEGRDAAVQAAAQAAEAEESAFGDSVLSPAEEVWLDKQEVADSGYVDSDVLEPEHVASPEAMLVEPAGDPVRVQDMKTGTWVELKVKEEWIRAQLTWASPAGTLFMFTSQAGTAHSMSRRTLDRLRAQGSIKVVAERNVVDEALDKVARAALKNSLDKKG
jgi:hypothetical protein